MDGIAERLRAERLRLMLSQTELAESGGVSRRALARYESGESHPDAVFLAAIAARGADIGYIVTGRHTQPYDGPQPMPAELCEPAAIYGISQPERVMIELFRELDGPGRARVLADAEAEKRVSELRAELDLLKKKAV